MSTLRRYDTDAEVLANCCKYCSSVRIVWTTPVDDEELTSGLRDLGYIDRE